jgi:NADH dehydrogenase (ubiquinone) Fe-S protein 1
MNSHITGVDDADLLLLVGTDLKQESPVFNARVMRNVRDNKLKVFTVGVPAETTYKTVHLGNTTKVI